MRVALVIDKYDPAGGGAECWTARHAEALLRDGHAVDIVARFISSPPDEATCHRVDGLARSATGRKLTLPDQLAERLARLPVDVIHDMGVGWYADLFMPHYGTRRGIYSQQSKLLAPPERWLRPLAYRILPRYRKFAALEALQFRSVPGRGDKRFLAVSQMVKDDMVRFNGADESRIDVVYNGVDTDRFRPDPTGEVRARVRARLGVGEHTVVFLLVAHDWDLKGLENLLRAFSLMVRARQDVALVVVGPGAMRGRKFWGIPLGRPNRRYPRLARRWGCDHAVRFVGMQHDPVPYYQAADVYVQPTLYDACSLVVLEAMACGLPVITSRYNGVSELIEHGTHGLVLGDPLDTAELLRCMERALHSSDRAAIADAARRLALEHTASANHDRVLRIYRQIVAERAERRDSIAAQASPILVPARAAAVAPVD